MKELSIFIDESGDFGKYELHSPYYIISMVFHDQSHSIQSSILNLDRNLSYIGLENHCIHTGPIIRKEEDYRYMDIEERRYLFNKITAFVRSTNVRYKCFYIEKKHISDATEATGKLAKSISAFLFEHYSEFLKYKKIKIYYDNGQIEINKLLSSVFHVMFPNIEFRKAVPSQYKLFQAADLICTLKLIELKLEHKLLSKSEKYFFRNIRTLKKNYLKPVFKKEWS